MLGVCVNVLVCFCVCLWVIAFVCVCVAYMLLLCVCDVVGGGHGKSSCKVVAAEFQ